MGTSAKYVSRKLIEQKHKRECSFWAFFPCRQFASRRRLMDRQKLRPDSQVEVSSISNHRSGPASRQNETTSANVTLLICVSRCRENPLLPVTALYCGAAIRSQSDG
jgi:hypothetical protein